MKNNSAFDGHQTHMFTSFPDSHQEDQNLLLENQDSNMDSTSENQFDTFNDNSKTYSVWQIEYYQRYFNVNTNEVIGRIIGSMVPAMSQNYLITKIRPNPDLYGPFWISSTLIFTIAIAGNIVNFFHNFGTKYEWQNDFHKVTSTAAVVFAYCWLVPTILYLLIRWRKSRADYQFVEILCVYGYSLSIYIPVAILWLINVSWLQWILVLVAVFLSGTVLVTTFWPGFSEDENKKVAIGVMALILALNALLGIGFMLYFFHSPSTDVPSNISTTTLATTTTTFHSSVNGTESG